MKHYVSVQPDVIPNVVASRENNKFFWHGVHVQIVRSRPCPMRGRRWMYGVAPAKVRADASHSELNRTWILQPYVMLQLCMLQGWTTIPEAEETQNTVGQCC